MIFCGGGKSKSLLICEPLNFAAQNNVFMEKTFISVLCRHFDTIGAPIDSGSVVNLVGKVGQVKFSAPPPLFISP